MDGLEIRPTSEIIYYCRRLAGFAMPDFRYVARDQAGQQSARHDRRSQPRRSRCHVAAPMFPLQVDDATPAGKSAPRSPRAGAHCWPSRTANWPTCCAAACRCCGARGDRKQTSHAGLKAVLEDIHRQVEDGSTLADAMGRFQPVFGEMAVSMVRAGGEGGFLEEALSRVAEFTETQDDLKKRTMGAVAYPAFLAVVGTIVVSCWSSSSCRSSASCSRGCASGASCRCLTDWLLATQSRSAALWGW